MKVKHNAEILLGDYQFAESLNQEVLHQLKFAKDIGHTNVKAFHTVWNWLPDNQKVKNLNLQSLRKEISIVDQNTTLFDDTVLNNIKYAKSDASNEEIFKAAEMAMCTDFINKLENKFETKIGENGVKLSGGEKQRLSIARAFLKDSKIILLDEATSSLDSETEEKIQKALEKLTSNKTTIVIAHRLSTILNSNKIYVLDKGVVVDEGKHDELLKNSEIYKNFYNRQIKEN